MNHRALCKLRKSTERQLEEACARGWVGQQANCRRMLSLIDAISPRAKGRKFYLGWVVKYPSYTGYDYQSRHGGTTWQQSEAKRYIDKPKAYGLTRVVRLYRWVP